MLGGPVGNVYTGENLPWSVVLGVVILKYYVSKTVATFDNCVIMWILEGVLEIYIGTVVWFLYFLKINLFLISDKY